MALPLLSDDAAFYTWAAATWVFTASVVVALVRCWVRGRGLRVEDVFTGFRAPLLLIAALLSQVSLRLYTVLVSIPERELRGQDAVGIGAAVERFLSDEAYTWPVGVCMFCLVVLLIFRAYAARRRRAPLPPRVGAAKRAGGCCSVSVTELVLFLVCVWTCVYSFPVMILDYMAATANVVSGAAAA